MKKIVFISSDKRTPVFFEAAKAAGMLEAIFWICTATQWRDWLVKAGIHPSRTLLIADKWKASESSGLELRENFKLLSSIEADNALNVRRIILSDRLLRHKSFNYGVSYLATVVREVQSFLTLNEVDYILMEPTWAHELIIAALAQQLSISVFAPASIRLPQGRFTFFCGIDHVDIGLPEERDNISSELAVEFIEAFRKSDIRPSYFLRNNDYFKVEASWITKFIATIVRDFNESRDETRRSAIALAKLRLTEKLKSKYLKYKMRLVDVNLNELKPYIYFPLHVQPEASVDVMGDRYTNQLEIVRAICSTTPLTHKIIVKEHSNFLGSKPISFYKELKKIPGVVVISPFTNGRELIENAELTVTVTGTASYEAALLGKPAITLRKMFFSPILMRDSWNPFSGNIAELLQSAKDFNNEESLVPFILDLFAKSLPGSVSDIRSDPNVLLPDNIKSFSSALIKMRQRNSG